MDILLRDVDTSDQVLVRVEIAVLDSPDEMCAGTLGACTTQLLDAAVGPGVGGKGSTMVAARGSENGDCRSP